MRHQAQSTGQGTCERKCGCKDLTREAARGMESGTGFRLLVRNAWSL